MMAHECVPPPAARRVLGLENGASLSQPPELKARHEIKTYLAGAVRRTVPNDIPRWEPPKPDMLRGMRVLVQLLHNIVKWQ